MKRLLLIPLSLTSFFCFSQINDALQFNGTSSYVQVADNNALDLSNNLTLEAWIYPTGPGSDATQGGMIMNKENSYEVNRLADGSLQFAFSANGAGTDWISTNTALLLPQDQWTHIALIKNSTFIIVLINGVLGYSDNSQPATLTANTQNLRFGTRSTGTLNYFAGDMDDIRIWNKARTLAEIKANMFNHNLSNSASGLVAYYRMNEGSGSTMGNSCTNTTGIDGTLVNSPAWVASPIQFAANALNFDGTDDYVAIPNTVSGDFTIEYWMNTTATGPGGGTSQWFDGNGIVDAEVGGATNDFGTALIADKVGFGIGNPDITIQSTSSVNTGSWVHVAATWTQSTGAMTLYINGTPEATGTSGTGSRTAPPRITIGETQSDIHQFNGSVDEVRIWNVVRTQTQIQADMNKELDPSTQTGLVAYYTFDQGIDAGANTGMIVVPDQAGNNNGTLTNFALSGSTSNFFAQSSTLSILPLQWLSFTVQIQGDDASLNWSTAEEQQTKDFVIQHSVNGVDWENIATIAAVGNSHQTNDYSYIDAYTANGLNYYRIEQRDVDGKVTYSGIRYVNLEMVNKSFEVVNNPIENGLLTIRVNKPIQLSLYGYNGMLHWQKNVNAGTSTIDVSKFAKGMYLLTTKDLSKKIVIR